MTRRLGVVVFVLAACFLSGGPYAQAQAPLPGLGSVMSALSIAQGGGIRLLGMGGVCTAVEDEANIRNAASLVWVTRATVDAGIVGTGTIDQGSGPEYAVRSYSLAQILPGRLAFAVRRTSLTSNSYLSPQLGSVLASEYQAVLVAGAARVGPRTSVGLTGALSAMHLQAVMPPALPYEIRAKGRGGIEAGAFHWLSDSLTAGAVYSYWDETEAWNPPLVPNATYRTEIIKGGLAYRPNQATTVAAEYAHLTYKNRAAGWEVADSRAYWGIERALTQDVCARAGSYGDAWTVGLGFRTGAWRLDYAYGRDLNEKSAEEIFPALGDVPGSDTHYLSAVIGF